MKNFDKVNVKQEARIELHDVLGLTGAEISINTLPAGASVPFVHSHKQIEVSEGDWLRLSPNAKRQFFASQDTTLKYICIQVKADSLEGYTMSDAIV